MLSRKTRFRRCSKGVSTVIGTIFLVLIALTVATNVFLWTFTQNATYNQAVKECSQMDADLSSERIVAYNTVYSVSQDEVEVNTTMTAQGALSAQIITVWVTWTDVNNITKYGSKTVNINLTPGDPTPLKTEVPVPGALDVGGVCNGWLVTARGNRVPLELKRVEKIIVASVAEGIGAISMNFDTFSYYNPPGTSLPTVPSLGTDLGNATHSFNLPSLEWIVFAVELTNLDESGKNITLYESSCIWLLAPPDSQGGVKGDTWYITRVANNKLASFSPQVLEYDTSTMIYFGPYYARKSTSPPGYITAVNILLFGTIGNDDYGQNIPFISIYIPY